MRLQILLVWHATLWMPPFPPGVAEEILSLSGQLEDLVSSLGPERVLGLLGQFEQSLSDVETALIEAVQKTIPSEIDEALHGLKGAALTLGLVATGTAAQDLRPPEHIT